MPEAPVAVKTDNAPKPAAHYSQGIRVGDFVFVSGQVGVAPEQSRKVAGGIEAETQQALKNIEAVLRACGGSLRDVVKTTCFVADKAEIPGFNKAYAQLFPDPPPARSTVEVGLTSGYLVEIEAIAFLPDSR